MKHFLEFFKDNFRFILAIITNFLALLAAIWWLIDSNYNSSKSLELEPIVTCIALTATLFGINFVNNKLSKPYLKIFLRMAMTKDPIDGIIYGVSVTIENHSILKAFISNFQIQLKNNNVFQFLSDGFTKNQLTNIAIEPGQAFSFHFIKSDLSNGPRKITDYGDLIITTQVGHKFKVPSKIVQEHLALLNESEKK